MKYFLIIKKHEDDNYLTIEQFDFTKEESETMDASEVLAGNHGIIWDYYDKNIYYVDNIEEEDEK